ncbi:IS3 family transposase [Pseudonocardia halophobica]|uniref:IS3 family transposase n=1 Tax=Pseudonocardia halophobica TaxID=29401 RepID=UPI003D93D361
MREVDQSSNLQPCLEGTTKHDRLPKARIQFVPPSLGHDMTMDRIRIHDNYQEAENALFAYIGWYNAERIQERRLAQSATSSSRSPAIGAPAWCSKISLGVRVISSLIPLLWV